MRTCLAAVEQQIGNSQLVALGKDCFETSSELLSGVVMRVLPTAQLDRFRIFVVFMGWPALDLRHFRGAAMRNIVATLVMAIFISVFWAAPGQAGEAEISLLRSYIGNWSGSSVLRGGDQPEAFSCRLRVTQGRLVKINYAGRCSLVNMNLSVSGTIYFNDEANRFEATMRSNVGLSAGAVGAKRDGSIVFKLSEKQSDRVGTPIQINAILELSSKQITVDFTVELNRSGQTLTTTVPFQRQ